jgi:hypothetical protein
MVFDRRCPAATSHRYSERASAHHTTTEKSAGLRPTLTIHCGLLTTSFLMVLGGNPANRRRHLHT